MKEGYRIIQNLSEGLLGFMEKHKFETIDQFKGHSLQFFTSHSDLVHRQAEARIAKQAESKKKMITADAQWTGEQFVEQSDALARG